MKNFKLQPTAFEWHNTEDGHCYIDYIPDTRIEHPEEYTKTPLYKLSDIKLLWGVYNLHDESIVSIHKQ